MARRINNKDAERAAIDWSKGLGGAKNTRPVCVKLPSDVDEIVKSLPNRSEKIRQWIFEGMQREELLPSLLQDKDDDR